MGGSAWVGGTFQWLDFFDRVGRSWKVTVFQKQNPSDFGTSSRELGNIEISRDFNRCFVSFELPKNVLQDGMREADFLRPDGMWLGPCTIYHGKFIGMLNTMLL